MVGLVLMSFVSSKNKVSVVIEVEEYHCSKKIKKKSGQKISHSKKEH